MHPSDLQKLAEKFPLSRSTLERNGFRVPDPRPPTLDKPAKRLRQSSKPLLNKLETEFLERLKRRCHDDRLAQQAVRFRLGNGIWYKPDFVVFGLDGVTAYEVKGPHAFRGGFENLKVAASQFRCVRFVLVWKENGDWQEQGVLP